MTTTLIENNQPGEVIKYETAVYMKVKTDANTSTKYYTLGRIGLLDHTLAVTEVHGNGGTLFFCEKHNSAYHPRQKCAGCSNAVVDVANDASVTGCDTPEFQLNSEGR